jgi:ATP synthase subunit 6
MLTNFNLLNSPFEPFVVNVLFTQTAFGFHFFTVTNQLIMLALFVFSISYGLVCLWKPKVFSPRAISSRAEMLLALIYSFILDLVDDNIHYAHKGEFVPYMFTLFLFVFGLNASGLIPYTFAVTGQLAFTLTMSYTSFIAYTIIGFRLHGIKFFGRFFPGNLSVFLAPLLVPIEVISYIFQPISLGVRLFANIMAGHILLLVFSGFIWIISHASGLLYLSQLIPIAILIFLCILEAAVALIQAYVFCLLTAIYFNDSINLH